MSALLCTQDGDRHGPLVALVHGSMDRSTSFAKLARRLPDLRVLRYDRRGYAGSINAGVAEGVGGHVDDLLSVLAGRPATVVGHSFGGVVALATAERAPEVVRSVLAYEAPTPWAPWWPADSAGSVVMKPGDAADAAERFMRRMVGDRLWSRMPQQTRDLRRAEGRALVGELRALRVAEAPFRPDAIAVPVLAVCGSESAERHRRATTELAEAVPGATVHTIEGARHGAHLSHPDELATLVRQAVARTGERTR
ncbi:alpha/beta hydrolase [soil metagenome]